MNPFTVEIATEEDYLLIQNGLDSLAAERGKFSTTSTPAQLVALDRIERLACRLQGHFLDAN